GFPQLAELKQECLARGLEAKGNKQDLIHRLQAYLEEHGEHSQIQQIPQNSWLEFPLPPSPEEEPKAPEPPAKVEEAPVKSPDRMQKRAERFNVPVSLESKKAARAARVFSSGAQEWGEFLGILFWDFPPNPKSQISQINLEKLKERAQRFGLNVSSLSKKVRVGNLGIFGNFGGFGGFGEFWEFGNFGVLGNFGNSKDWIVPKSQSFPALPTPTFPVLGNLGILGFLGIGVLRNWDFSGILGLGDWGFWGIGVFQEF
uniref:SAP domain-containing protein n=1 Tax=Catharus ustulatus TaxID=91951 RepID=A0A8C3U889_CATUS